MNLKRDGFYAKLWSWFYLTRLPNSLCAFFWSFIGALVFSPLLFIIVWPTMVSDWIQTQRAQKELRENHPRYQIAYPDLHSDNWFDRFKGGFAYYFIFFILFIFFRGWIHVFRGWYATANATVSILLTFCAIGVAVIFFIIHKIDKKKKEKWLAGVREKPKKKNKFVEMTQEYIKGFMGKYCPRINWQ